MLLALWALACVPKAPPAATPSATVVQLDTGGVSAPDRDAILRAVATAAVRPCFEALLGRDPTRYGEVVVRFSITAAGTVDSTAPEFSTLGDDAAASCVAEAVKGVAFPPRDASISVLYPFLLLTERTPPEVARALKDRYGLLTDADRKIADDPRTPPPPGVVVVW